MTLTKLLIFTFTIGLVLSTALILIVFFRMSGHRQTARAQSLRDQHRGNISRFGGLGIAGAFFLTVVVIFLLPASERGIGPEFLADPVLLTGALGAFLLGLADDLWPIRARYKLMGQILIGAMVSYFGLRVHTLDLPLFGANLQLGWMGFPLTLFWIIGIMNAVNLVDGLDGLASGISLIALCFLGYISFIHGREVELILCAALLGATLGFWLFNNPPAALFMGDSGSLFLGYMLAVLSLRSVAAPGSGAVNLVPVLILAVPILDTSFSLFRRYLRGIPFYSADRDHFHHRLLNRGLSTWQAILFLFMVSLVFGGLAVSIYHLDSALHTYLYLAAVLLAYLVLLTLEYDIIKKPFASLRKQPRMKRQRNLMLSISENMDMFLLKDQTLDELFRSFSFWCMLVGIDGFAVLSNGNTLHRDPSFANTEQTTRHLVFLHSPYEVRLKLPLHQINLDSDVKGELMERVVPILIGQLQMFDEKGERRHIRMATGISDAGLEKGAGS